LVSLCGIGSVNVGGELIGGLTLSGCSLVDALGSAGGLGTDTVFTRVNENFGGRESRGEDSVLRASEAGGGDEGIFELNTLGARIPIRVLVRGKAGCSLSRIGRGVTAFSRIKRDGVTPRASTARSTTSRLVSSSFRNFIPIPAGRSSDCATSRRQSTCVDKNTE
jgi:hypothetical protein